MAIPKGKTASTVDDLLADMEASLRIDKHDLDEELIRSGEVHYKAASNHAMASSRRDAAKRTLKEVEAAAYLRVREAAVRREEKLTEAAVEAKVLADAEVRSASQMFLSINEEAERWFAMRESYGQRNYALKDLVKLHGDQYYSETSGGREVSGARERVAKEVRQAQSDARNRRG